MRYHPFHFQRRKTFASLLIIAITILLSMNEISIGGKAGFQLFANAEEVATPPTAEGVITLNAKNFDSSLSDGNVWLIEFYAPW